MLWGRCKEQNTRQRKGCDPCKVPLVTPDLQNFIISASVCLIIRTRPSSLSLESAYVGVCMFVRGGVMRPADTLSLIISEHSLQTFIDQPQLHQSFALPSYPLGWPTSHLTTAGLILSKAASVQACTVLKTHHLILVFVFVFMTFSFVSYV